MFKKNSKVLSVLVLSLSLFISSFGSNSVTVNAAGTEKNEADWVRSVLIQYEDAAIDFDVDRLVELSLDLSWPNPEQFAKNIEKLNEKVYKFETIALEKVEEDLYHATVLAETESLKETKLEVPVLNLNGQWKVIVGQDMDENTKNRSLSTATDQSIKSVDFYKDYFTNYNVNNTIGIQPFGTSVEYYSFSFSYTGSVDSDTWTNTNSTPTIKGYQEPNGGHGNWIDIDYQLRSKTLFGSSALSPNASVKFTGKYAQSGTWYEKQWYGVVTDKTLLLRITNNDNAYYVSGAGNVYN